MPAATSTTAIAITIILVFFLFSTSCRSFLFRSSFSSRFACLMPWLVTFACLSRLCCIKASSAGKSRLQCSHLYNQSPIRLISVFAAYTDLAERYQWRHVIQDLTFPYPFQNFSLHPEPVAGFCAASYSPCFSSVRAGKVNFQLEFLAIRSPAPTNQLVSCAQRLYIA